MSPHQSRHTYPLFPYGYVPSKSPFNSSRLARSVLFHLGFIELTFSADGDELDSLAGDEVESFVHVGDLVEPHLAAVWLRESLARDDLRGNTRGIRMHVRTKRSCPQDLG